MVDFPDKEIVCKGTVKRKWEENGEKLVELSIWTEGEDGEITTPGTALVIIGSIIENRNDIYAGSNISF